MPESTQTALTVYKKDVVSLITSDPSGSELINAINKDKALKVMLQKQEMGFVSVNVNETMKNLIQVSDLLMLAFANSKGLPCSTLILGMQSDYQDLVKKSMVTTGAFFRTALNALDYHEQAILMFEEAMKPENKDEQTGLIDGAMEALAACSTVAGEMKDFCNGLIEDCNGLIKQSKDSLLAANNDSNAATAERKKIEDRIINLTAMQAELETKQCQYNLAIKKYDKDQEKLDKKAEKAMYLELAATITAGICQAAGSIGSAAVAVYGGPQAQIAKTASTLVRSSTDDSPKKAGAKVVETAVTSDEIAQKVLEQVEKKSRNKASIEANKKQLKESKEELDKEKKKVERLKSSGDTSGKLNIAESKVKFLEAQIKELNDKSKNLEEAGKKIEEAGKALSNSMEKVSDKAAKQAESFSQRAQDAGDKAYEFRKLEAQVSGELKKVVITLAATKTSKNTIEKTLASLEVVLAVLGKIKTAFSNTKVFWEGVQAHCATLASGASKAESFKKTIKIKVRREKLMLTVKGTALSWMALAHINYRAHNAMKLAGAKVDEAMSNIPGADECEAIVDKLSPQILKQIKAEEAARNRY